MKIVFDCRHTRLERHDGISRYTAELVTALSKLHPVTMLISDERQLTMLPDLPWIMGCDPTSPLEPWVAKTVNKAKPDVVFSPMQMMGSIGRRYKLILTLHDLIYYTHRLPPRDLSLFLRVGWRAYHLTRIPVRLLLRRADAVVTVSETSRQGILAARLYRGPVTVVRNGFPLQKPAPRVRPTAKTLVYMGSFMPYKEVDTIARALEELPGYRLHLLSRIGPADRSRIEALAPAGSVVFHDGVSDEEYFQILSEATALVSASRAEGFGIPLVESMRVGTPVVLSDIPVFHEVGGDVAEFFPPGDASGLARAVHAVDRPGEWEERSMRSVTQAGQFTWESSAARLLELMRSLVGEK